MVIVLIFSIWRIGNTRARYVIIEVKPWFGNRNRKRGGVGRYIDTSPLVFLRILVFISNLALDSLYPLSHTASLI